MSTWSSSPMPPQLRLRYLVLLSVLGLALFLLLLHPSPEAEAKTVGVDEHGGEEFTNISRALENATEGDTILVRAGNYSIYKYSYASLLKENLSLKGAGPKRCNLTVYIRYIYGVFGIGAENVTISGFSLSQQGGWSDTFSISANNATLRNCSFVGNWSKVSIGYRWDVNFTGNQLHNTLLSVMPQGLDMARTLNISNNTIGGRPLYYLLEKTDSVISENAGGYILIACSNISFKGLRDEKASIGIYLRFCSNVTISNCEINSLGQGVTLSYCQDTLVENNIITGNSSSSVYGIYISGDRNTVRNNQLDQGGIYLGTGKDAVVENNTLKGSSDGTVAERYYGICLSTNENVRITGNQISEGGLYFYNLYREEYIPYLRSFDIRNNSVDGRPIYYYINEARVKVPEDAGQIFLISCDNMTMSDLKNLGPSFTVVLVDSANCSLNSLEVTEAGARIQIYYSNCTRVENCSLAGEDNWLSIELWYSSHSLITNSSFSNNNFENFNSANVGVYSRHSENLTICYNTISNNRDYGISMSDSQGLIAGNEVMGNGVGIYANYGSSETIVICNNILDNRQEGLNAYASYSQHFQAPLNWWGSETGPYHENLNQNGTGDNITNDGIIVQPWASVPVVWNGTVWLPSTEEPGPFLPPDIDLFEEDKEASLADNLCLGVIFLGVAGLLAAILGSILLPDNFFAFLRPEAGVNANGAGPFEAGKENDKEPEKEKLTKEEPTISVEEPGEQPFLSQMEVDSKKKSAADGAPAQEAEKDAGPLCLSCPLCGARFNVEQGAGALKTRCLACGQEVRLECL